MSTAALASEARLFAREPASLFWILLFPALLLLVIGIVPPFAEPQEGLGGQRVVDLYAPVCALLAMLFAAVSTMPSVLAGYRETGVLRRLRTTPLHPSAVLGAQVGLHAGAVVVSVALALVVGRLVHDVDLAITGWLVLGLLLATAASFAIGAVVTALSPNVRVAQTVGTLVLFPSMFAAGVWLPVQAMPGVLRDVVGLTPVGAASETIHAATLGGTPDLLHVAVVVGWTLVLALVAVRSFRWE